MDLTDLGKKPISEEMPAGENISYSPEFESVQHEIDKLSIATAGAGEVDWTKVFNVSVSILEKLSKNLLVAAYLAEALIKTQQFDGLCQGTQILKDMVEIYWDTLYPPKKRLKGRINALKWWYGRVETFLKGFETGPLPEKDITHLKETLLSLDQLLADKVENAPILMPLVRYVDNLPVEVEQPAVVEQETPGEAESPAEKIKETVTAPKEPSGVQPVTAQQPVNQPIESDQDANKSLNAALNTLARLAGHFMKSDLASPLPYRLNRLYTWLTVEQLPMVQEDNKTPLPPPETMIKKGMEAQLSGREYENVIQTAEARLRDNLFWLDLNRLTATALDELGGKYARAHDMVCMKTAMFVKKLPNLEKLAFSDGTPFADNETRAWLKSIAQANADDDTAAPGSDDGAILSRFNEIESNARQLVKGKKIYEAVVLFQENLIRCGSGREKLMFQTGLSRMLMDMGKIGLAIPHLTLILQEIESFHLEEWEPDLALLGLRLIYEGFRDCDRDDLKENAQSILDRITKINPATAYKLFDQ